MAGLVASELLTPRLRTVTLLTRSRENFLLIARPDHEGSPSPSSLALQCAYNATLCLTSPRIASRFAIGIPMGNCVSTYPSAPHFSAPVLRLRYLLVMLGLRELQAKERQTMNPKSGMIMMRTVMGESMIWKTTVRRDLSGHIVGKKGIKRKVAKRMLAHASSFDVLG